MAAEPSDGGDDRRAVLAVFGGRDLLVPNALVNLFAVHADFLRRENADADLVALDPEDSHRDVVTDHQRFADATRDVARQIGHAGGVAKEQLDELVTGFNRLNQFGEASGRQVATLRDKIAEALNAFSEQVDQLEQIAGARFAELTERSAPISTAAKSTPSPPYAAAPTRCATNSTAAAGRSPRRKPKRSTRCRRA